MYIHTYIHTHTHTLTAHVYIQAFVSTYCILHYATLYTNTYLPTYKHTSYISIERERHRERERERDICVYMYRWRQRQLNTGILETKNMIFQRTIIYFLHNPHSIYFRMAVTWMVYRYTVDSFHPVTQQRWQASAKAEALTERGAPGF